MTNFYLASSLARKAEIEAIACQVRSLGGTVVSRWHTAENPALGSDERDAVIAKVDEEDMNKADVIVAFTGHPSTRGGYHTEIGLARGLTLDVWIVGPIENAFQRRWAENVFENPEDFISKITEWWEREGE